MENDCCPTKSVCVQACVAVGILAPLVCSRMLQQSCCPCELGHDAPLAGEENDSASATLLVTPDHLCDTIADSGSTFRLLPNPRVSLPNQGGMHLLLQLS